VLFALHLPFISADPFIPLDDSRGAFTDEGLYLFQMENLWETGILAINQADGLLKTPLYNLLLLPFQLFGSLLIFRVCCLLFFVLALRTLSNRLKINDFFTLGLLLLLTLQTTLFMHVHLALAEVFVAAFVCLSIGHLNKVEHFAIAASLIIAAVACKIQYAYLLMLILPLLIYQIKSQTFQWKKWWLPLGLFTIFVGFCFSQSTGYQYIISHQQVGKFQDFGNWFFRAKANLIHLCQDPFTLSFLLFFIVIALFLGYYYVNKRVKPSFILLFMSIVWLLESHKLLYVYLPQRYLVLWFLLMVCIILFGIKKVLSIVKPKRNILIGLSVALLMLGIFQYASLYKTRSFEMIALHKSILAKLPKNATVTGPWAPSLCFGSKVTSATAWNNYYENEALWNKAGAYIIMEKNQSDVDSLFSKQLNPDLKLIPITNGTIRHWEIGLWKVIEK